ncbi:metallopeptidase family M24-domain-containing protein [Xylariaceae sp. FL0804]|nr:metallopeptidase family M24-domain-containing protein [Xylariaceae sp. FL0804]
MGLGQVLLPGHEYFILVILLRTSNVHHHSPFTSAHPRKYHDRKQVYCLCEMDATDFDHDLVDVGEFGALSVEPTVPEPTGAGPVRKYPAKLHARRVAQKLGASEGLVFLPGQLESTWEDSDQGPPFRQRRYFYYVTGANFPGCSATYDIAADKLTLWIPFTPPATILWFGKTPSPEDCLSKLDVHDVKYKSELPAYLSSRLSTVRKLYALRASQLPKFDGFERVKAKLHIDTAALQPAIDRARVIKSDYELDMIRKANYISSEAHEKIAQSIRVMTNECQLEAAFVGHCTARNAHAQAYPVIAGAGANGSTLHYEANNEPLAGRQLVVLDAGAEWDCYASDVTRTLPIGPTLTPEARAIYALVHQMQDECIHKMAPGVVFRDLQLHATLVAVKGLLRLGVLRNGRADEIFKNGTGAAFFPHGLGHHVGLDVHDVLSQELAHPAGESLWGKRRPIGPQSIRAMIRESKAATSGGGGDDAAPGEELGVLAPGMVVTVEPGLYFCRPYIEAYFLRNREHARYLDRDVLDRYWDVGGVRVEDCVRITEHGFEDLTTAPKGDALLDIVGLGAGDA